MTSQEITNQHNQQNIKIAVDNCIFTIKDSKLQVLLIKMKDKLSDHWALPGGLIHNQETPDDSAKRILKEQTGVDNVYLEQLYTFGQLDRDPFGRVTSIAYFALIPSNPIKLETTVKYTDIRWWPIDKLPKLAYDHDKITSYAKQRLAWKISYTNVVWSLLPAKFTLTDLQKVYEIILDRAFDKRNFRKKIMALKLIRQTTGLQSGPHRPAKLYEFISKKPKIVEIL
jgi:8-oxo-dGTP diphosphatase